MIPMKKHILAIALAFLGSLTLHAEKAVPGPKGGRLLDAEPLRAELVVGADRALEVVFYDAAMKPVAAGAQTVAVTAEAPSGRVKVELKPTATGFVSATPLPEGTPYRIVVQIKATADAKPKNHRVDLNLGNCGGCNRAEYACTCDSH
jgi:hypothetical protein